MFLRLSTVETGDGHCLDGGRIDQVPVVEQLIDDLASLVYFEFTESLDGIEVLGIEGPKAGSVEVGVEDPVAFAEVDIIDDMAAQKIGGTELSRVPFKTGGDGEDVFSDSRNHDMRSGQRKRERM